VEQTRRSLIFDIRVVQDWPGVSMPSCVSRAHYAEGLVDITRRPDCPEEDLADLKAWPEKGWQEYQRREVNG